MRNRETENERQRQKEDVLVQMTECMIIGKRERLEMGRIDQEG